MNAFPAIDSGIDVLAASADPRAAARGLVELAEEVLEQWVVARGDQPTAETTEGFRLLACEPALPSPDYQDSFWTRA